MKSRKLAVTTAVAIGLSGVFTFSGTNAYAAGQDLQNKINDVQGKRSNLQKDLKTHQDQIKSLQNQQSKLDKEIERLDKSVEETSDKVRAKRVELKETQDKINQLKKEIQALTERINQRTELLKDRARSFQQNGGSMDYLGVLLGAQSFSDFISRMNAVGTIVQADKDLLEQHEKDKKDREQKETEVQKELEEVQETLTDLDHLRKKLQSEVDEKNKLMSSLKVSEVHEHTETLSLQDQDKLLADQETAYKNQLAAWEKKEAERKREEAKKQAAAELARKEALKQHKAAARTPQAVEKVEEAPAPSAPTPATSAGNFTSPAAGPVTSEFGGRWGTHHDGVDIGKRASEVPIVAAADGQVVRAYHSSSYGNCVFIVHSINGKMYTTVYAHMEKYLVSVGQSVSKGQQIGYMGSTGHSTGPHLHFELHEGPWNMSKSNAVDPRRYINF
ncbi:murein hydrolase activator EnvC family protein [Priestia koreensis]|uniref:murein hydrolase activator EnvC family protein n=1 Tax=Priestia koreensis TaxID=284581 RepID=UPI003D03A2F4